MKYYKNYILKKLTEVQVKQIKKDYENSLKYFKNTEPLIIPYEYNSKYYYYKIDS